jgi:3-oxoacyl-[acyl-carrier-protein] synthase-3
MTTRGRGVSVIFGDGAGAAILSREEDLTKGILSTHLHSEGQHAEELIVKHQEWEAVGLQIFWQTMIQMMKVISYMNGQFVFQNAVVRFSEVINEGLPIIYRYLILIC